LTARGWQVVGVHELSLCRAIARVASEASQGRPVRRIGLRVGTLRQVVPGTLVWCWSLVSEDTALAGSVLDVEPVPAAISCAACGQTCALTEPVLRCPACDSTDVTVVAGEEFLLTTLDVVEV
jgi:hydrogenase nickel incorporation protein HypA/HybF